LPRRKRKRQTRGAPKHNQARAYSEKADSGGCDTFGGSRANLRKSIELLIKVK
jgi:hypothetical protein